MVGVAQLVESRIVIPVVVGSSPIFHPTETPMVAQGQPFFCLKSMNYRILGKILSHT